MEQIIETLAEGDKLLLSVGEKFASVGMSEQSVTSFLRGNDVKMAIETCMLLNQWDRAVELAEEHNFPAIEGVLSKYANQLLAKGKTVQAINLYRKANRHTDTAKLLIKLARCACTAVAIPSRGCSHAGLCAGSARRTRPSRTSSRRSSCWLRTRSRPTATPRSTCRWAEGRCVTHTARIYWDWISFVSERFSP